MGLFDKNRLMSQMMGAAEKAKNTASGVVGVVKNSIETAKLDYEQKKKEDAEHALAMNARAAEKSQEIINAILAYENNGSFFKNTTRDELLSFTKDFFDKVLLPASSVTHSKITMYPYIENKQLQKNSDAFPELGAGEATLVYLKAEAKQEIVITDQALYFSLALDEDPKFFARGRIPAEEVSVFSTEKTESAFLLKCDEYVLGSFAIDKSTAEDFVTLNNYFQCIINHDFEITDQEVDELIREKIGESVYNEIKKYMIYDDELMVYFAWGLDSLSAKDYIVCTNKQIIIMNREMLGATANIKQLYYEDITSASTEQNSKSSDFTVALLETAITAAAKTCDLIITAAGSVTKINTLYKIEAERVVSVYHQFRKLAKTSMVQPQTIVQKAPEADPLEQLEKLAKLKAAGIITEEEFNQKKVDLLNKL